MIGRKSQISTPEQEAQIRHLCQFKFTLEQIALQMNVGRASVRWAIKRLGIQRIDLRKGKREKPILQGEDAFPQSYKDYVIKAGYGGLKHSMGELVAFKKKKKVVE